MQSRSILFLGIVLVLAGLSIWRLAKWPFSYGLDVKGGVRFVYQMDVAKLTPDQKKEQAKIQDNLVKIMETRARGNLGVTEPTVAKKGDDSVIIELPGFTSIDEARRVIGSSAKVIVYWAKNVSTQMHPNRRYGYSQTHASTDDPAAAFSFFKTSDPSKIIVPANEGKADPDYLEMISGWDPILQGDEVDDATAQIIGTGAKPLFHFNPSGAKKLEAWSRRYNNKGEHIAFVLDNKVLSIAPVKDGPQGILSDNAQIDGEFSPKYVKNLCDLIKAGSLPVDLIELSSEQVDPTIGNHALTAMVSAGIWSLAIVCVLLIFYYAWPGVIATFAMTLYAVFTLALLNAMQATFSLAAIAAFILSTGMAVDANILVFERLKEELRDGKELFRASNIAFNRALTAIVDSNVSTVLTCMVLWFFGTGPVKGFASTLAYGVIISFFTAFVVTRSILQGLLALGIGRNTKWYVAGRGWFSHHQEFKQGEKLLNIVGRSNFYFLLSAALIVPGFIFVAMGGIKPNVEFQGGYQGTYMLPEGATQDTIRKGLESAGFQGSNIELAMAGGKRIVYITIPPIKGMTVNDPKAKDEVAKAAGLPTDNSSFTAIGPTVQKETVQNAINGVIVASILIMLYLGIRFGISVGGIKNGFKFGASAVIALVHDVLFVIGTAGIVGYFLHWEISALFITAMLTVIGFSVHDTIIIFDRIRENLRRQQKGETFEHLCDKSVSQSVARSLNTSLSAIFPLAVLIAIGTPTPELKFMCLSMLLGISIGAYSSIFNATPILYLWNKAVMKKQGEQAGLMQEAAREAKAAAQRAAAAAAGAPAVPVGPASPAAGSAYGQIKRRSGVVEQSKKVIDEDEE